MENRPPFLDDGRTAPENLSTTTWNACIQAFCIAASHNAADDDGHRAARGPTRSTCCANAHGIAPEYGLWSMVASDEENWPRR